MCTAHCAALAGMYSSDTSAFRKDRNAYQLTSHVLLAAGPFDFHAGSSGPGGNHTARRSLTNLSELGAEKSPESASRFRSPPESLEAQLSHKLQASCYDSWKRMILCVLHQTAVQQSKCTAAVARSLQTAGALVHAYQSCMWLQ